MDWWTAEQGGLVGAVLGASVGVVLGGIGGGVCVPLAFRGRARGFVTVFLWVCLAAGFGLLAAGVAALIMGQPYHVWYALLLPGVICTPLSVMMVFKAKHAYRRSEERRLAAEELRRG